MVFRSDRHDSGGGDMRDILTGIEHLVQKGIVDARRQFVYGVSYGGFMTNMAMFRAPGVFKAGSSWAAVNDWENYNHGYTRERLTTPAENPEAYRRSSPITFSHNLKDNLLLIHGMVDSNVLFQDTVQLTEKLIQEGRPFEERHPHRAPLARARGEGSRARASAAPHAKPRLAPGLFSLQQSLQTKLLI